MDRLLNTTATAHDPAAPGHRRGYRGAQAQRGAVLLTALLFLTILTILAVNAAISSSVEIRMAAGMGDLSHAFQAGDSALRDAESWIAARTTRPIPDSTGSTCTSPCVLWEFQALGTFPDISVKNHAWWQANARAFSGAIAAVASQPRYVIEEQMFAPDSLTLGLGVPSGQYYYRITSRGTGGTDEAQTMVQSSYARRY